MTMEEIARKQVTLIENIERDVTFLRTTTRLSLGKAIGGTLDKMLGIDENKALAKMDDMVENSGLWMKTHIATVGGALNDFAEPLFSKIRKGTEILGIGKLEDLNKQKSNVENMATAMNIPVNEINKAATNAEEKEEPKETVPQRYVIDFNWHSPSPIFDKISTYLMSSDPKTRDQFWNYSLLNPKGPKSKLIWIFV